MRLRRQALGVLALELVVASLVAGCASPPKPFTPEFYVAPKVSALPAPSAAVSVFRFVDTRPGVTDPRMVYRFESISEIIGESPLVKSLNAVRSTEPVDLGVTRAVLEGLRARGLSTIDMITTFFEPGQSAGAARIGITGKVVEFWVLQFRRGIYDYGFVASCTIRLEVFDAGSGKKLLERTYSRVEKDTGISLANPWPSLARILAAVVEEAAGDPALLAVLR